MKGTGHWTEQHTEQRWLTSNLVYYFIVTIVLSLASLLLLNNPANLWCIAFALANKQLTRLQLQLGVTCHHQFDCLSLRHSFETLWEKITKVKNAKRLKIYLSSNSGTKSRPSGTGSRFGPISDYPDSVPGLVKKAGSGTPLTIYPVSC